MLLLSKSPLTLRSSNSLTQRKERIQLYVSCVELSEELAWLISSLKTTSTRRLPSYVDPSRFTTLNQSPLASSGKLDRKSFTAFSRARQHKSFPPPPPPLVSHKQQPHPKRKLSNSGKQASKPKTKSTMRTRRLWIWVEIRWG